MSVLTPTHIAHERHARPCMYSLLRLPILHLWRACAYGGAFKKKKKAEALKPTCARNKTFMCICAALFRLEAIYIECIHYRGYTHTHTRLKFVSRYFHRVSLEFVALAASAGAVGVCQKSFSAAAALPDETLYLQREQPL